MRNTFDLSFIHTGDRATLEDLSCVGGSTLQQPVHGEGDTSRKSCQSCVQATMLPPRESQESRASMKLQPTASTRHCADKGHPATETRRRIRSSAEGIACSMEVKELNIKKVDRKQSNVRLEQIRSIHHHGISFAQAI